MISSFPIKKLTPEEFPQALLEIPQVPKQLFIRGTFPKDLVMLAVVGTRKYTPYGKEACKKLIAGLQGYPICIVSGLALGIDSIAHETALNAKLTTLAIPGSGLDSSVIYPRSNLSLAERILNAGGCLLSEFIPTEKAALWTFPQRNRIMAGISKAVLIIEAEEKSGTMITARLATDYNRDVLTVPGSIFSPTSSGPALLLRLGATPITKSEDILDALGFSKETKQNTVDLLFNDLNEEEKQIVLILKESTYSREDLATKSGFDISKLNTILMMLEIKGVTQELLGKISLV